MTVKSEFIRKLINKKVNKELKKKLGYDPAIELRYINAVSCTEPDGDRAHYTTIDLAIKLPTTSLYNILQEVIK